MNNVFSFSPENITLLSLVYIHLFDGILTLYRSNSKEMVEVFSNYQIQNRKP